MSNPEKSKLVQFKEIADHFDVSIQTVRSWVRDKKIPFVRLGNVYRFRIEEVEMSLRSEAVGQTSVESDEDDSMTDAQIHSGIARVNSLGMLYYRRPEYRKKIREIMANRPFNQRLISHLFTGIPIRLSTEEIADLFQMSELDLKRVLSRQSIMLHPNNFPEELHTALMEEYEKIEVEEQEKQKDN